MQTKSFRSIVLIFFLAITVIVLGFTGLLNISSFNKNITDSLVSSYAVPGRECVRKIEYALRYGKTLSSFYGIEELLHEVKENFPEITKVQVLTPEGEILFDDQGIIRNQYIEHPLMEATFLADSFALKSFAYTLFNDEYHLFLPINDRDNTMEGSLHLAFPKEIISSLTASHTGKLTGYLGLLALAGILALLLLNRFVSFTTPSGEIKRKTFLVTVLLLLGIIQVVFGWLNFNMFRSGYMETARKNSILLSTIIQKDIESVVNRGVPYQKLYNLEGYLERITGTIPEIDSIQLSTQDEAIFYSTAGSVTAGNADPSMVYTQPLGADDTGSEAKLQLFLSEDFFAGKDRDILLDSITMLALSIILMVEIVIFMIILLRYQFEKKTSPAGKASFDITIIRPLTLLIAVSVFLSGSFIPLRMKELAEPLWGLSENVILGLPVSAEMLFTGLAAVLAGSLIDSRGWRSAFLLGTVFYAVGLYFSYQAQGALTFIGARSIAGAGYGFTIMALRGFVNSRKSEKEKAEGFSSYISGLYAGFIIGVAVGAMLADRIGFARVFLVSLAFCLLAGVLIMYFIGMREMILNTNKNNPYWLGAFFTKTFVKKEVAAGRAFAQSLQEESRGSRGKVKGLLFFLGNLPVLGFFLFALLPLTMCGMFLDYFFPVFAASQNISTSDVGRAFMLNGIAVVYLGPVLTAYTFKKMNMEKAILLSGLVVVLAFILFYYSGTVAAAFLAAILLGVSDSFGLVAQNNYFVGLKAVESVGQGLSLGYYDNIRNLGKMIGPILFGGLMVMGNAGIGLVGIVTLVLLIFFCLSARLEKARNNP